MLAAASVAFGRCDPAIEPDGSDVEAARTAIAARCDCAGAARHGDFVSCAAAVASEVLANPSCRGFVRRCAARSTCGRGGAVTCCRTRPGRPTKCSIKHDAVRCTAPRGGTACVGLVASCCDACGESGCETTTTTTTTTLSSCGGFSEPCCEGEACNESGLVCAAGTCDICGFLGHPCCPPALCHSFPLTQCVNGNCQ